VTASTPDLGEAREVLPVDDAAVEVRTCFNADYIDDFLGVVETEGIQMALKDEMGPIVMTPVGADGYEYIYVIMPMRI